MNPGRAGPPLAAVFALSLLVAVLASSSPVRAAGLCEDFTRLEYVHQADTIFTGRVAAVDAYSQRLTRLGGHQLDVPRWLPAWLPVPAESKESRVDIRFRVDTLYKGSVGQEVSVRWAGRNVPFRPGLSYTIFANRDQGQLWTTQCSGNLAGGIEPNLYGLSARRLGSRPQDAPSLRWGVVGVGLLVVAVSLLIVVLNRRRTTRARPGSGQGAGA